MINGVEYVTASDIRARFPEVTPARLRDWRRRGLLAVVTKGELAAAKGWPVPPSPDTPARLLHRSSGRWESVCRWSGPGGVAVVEADTGASPVGRKRVMLE